MLRLIHVWDRGRGALSFAPDPDRPGDRPVFAALVNQVGTRVTPSELWLGRWPGDPLSPGGFVLAARHRMFRLRPWTGRRVTRRKRPVATPAPAPRLFVASSRTGPIYAVRAASIDEARAFVAGEHPADARLTVAADAGDAARLGLFVLPRPGLSIAALA